MLSLKAYLAGCSPNPWVFRSWIEYFAHTSGGKGFFVLVGVTPGSDVGMAEMRLPVMTAAQDNNCEHL